MSGKLLFSEFENSLQDFHEKRLNMTSLLKKSQKNV